MTAKLLTMKARRRPVRKYPRAGNPNGGGMTLWHGMSLRTIAKRTGLHLSTISRVYNRVRRPSFQAAPGLANALGITMEQLFIELNSPRRVRDRLPGAWQVDARVDVVRDAKRLARLGRPVVADATPDVQPDDIHATSIASGLSVQSIGQSEPL